MNQINWTYLADNGKQHHVGLAHGAESGHLLVHCNSKVILIDFKVWEDASYSVFIDEQLCEISIFKNKGQYSYSFEINNKADTPRNRARKKVEKQHLLQSLAFLGTLVIAIAVVLFSISKWNNYHYKKDFAAKVKNAGKQVNARILMPSEEEVEYASYFFIVNGKSYAIATTLKNEEGQLLSNGFPLQEGDEFIVNYLPNNPSINEIDYHKPTLFQINRYKDRVLQVWETNTQLNNTQKKCLVDYVANKYGVEGLAQLYYYKAPTHKNLPYDRKTFQDFKNNPSLQEHSKLICNVYL